MEDYSYCLYSSGKHYGASPTFIRRDQLPREGFTSLYWVTKETAEAIVAAGTTAGFKGCVWAERLWMDFDSYPAAERAEGRLRGMGYDFIAFDTGGRGAHFGILRSSHPSHLLPVRDKRWVTENFPEADRSIYTHLHPFRLEGTAHEKTGDSKRLVCDVRGSTLELPPFEKEELSIDTSSSGQRGVKSVFSCYRVMREVTAAPSVKSGERHYALVRLIYALRDDAGVDAMSALYWVLEWNKFLREPKDEQETAKVVQSIYRG